MKNKWNIIIGIIIINGKTMPGFRYFNAPRVAAAVVARRSPIIPPAIIS